MSKPTIRYHRLKTRKRKKKIVGHVVSSSRAQCGISRRKSQWVQIETEGAFEPEPGVDFFLCCNCRRALGKGA